MIRAFSLALVVGGVCWHFTQDRMTAIEVGFAFLLGSFLTWLNARWKTQKEIFLELQQFLIRCRVLPEDYKITRNAFPGTIKIKKRELMDAAQEQIQEGQKNLSETRHVLDKFIGTKASHFALQKGHQAIWEGELTRAIVLFSDVRGFTSMTEKLKTQETVRYLNRMFTELEEVIASCGGEINKFMGDAILAFFPYPKESIESSVKKALSAALRMQDGFHQIQETFRENYSESVYTGLGIGIVGGEVIIGNLGSARRMEFTLIGDTVNFASRLCSIASDGQILVNEDLALVGGGSFRIEALEPVRIKGKSGTHRPYSVLGEKLQPGLT